LAVSHSDILSDRVENISVFHVFALETSKNQDFIVIHLGDTGALSGGELISWEVYELPFVLGCVVILLN
jgi:hypothetical protein